MVRHGSGWIVGLALVFGAAQAAEPLVAVHPLVVLEGDQAETVRLQNVFQADLAERHIDLVKPECIDGALKVLPKTGCAADDACLARLARTCGAKRSVYVAAVSSPGKVVLSGKVVRANGMTERTVSGIEVYRTRGPSGDAALRQGIKGFLSDELRVDSMDLEPLVEAPKAVVGGIDGPTRQALRIAGWSVGGTAVATAIAGGAVWLGSLGPRRELSGMLTSGGAIPAGDARAALLDERLNRDSKWSAGLLIGAGALAVSSAVLLLLSIDPPPNAPKVSVGGSDRDIGFVVSGRF